VRKIFTVLIASFVLAALVPTTATSATCRSYSKSERAFAKKVNAARDGRGIRRLKLDPQLSKVAMKQTRSMTNQNRLFHTPNLGERVTNWTKLGENVGYGGTVRSIHRMFMRSSGHKANVLNRDFRFVGVGTKKAHGYLWVTVVFQATRNPGTTLKMKKQC
jgi:uncharacterized protein YkwD